MSSWLTLYSFMRIQKLHEGIFNFWVLVLCLWHLNIIRLWFLELKDLSRYVETSIVYRSCMICRTSFTCWLNLNCNFLLFINLLVLIYWKWLSSLRRRLIVWADWCWWTLICWIDLRNLYWVEWYCIIVVMLVVLVDSGDFRWCNWWVFVSNSLRDVVFWFRI